ncbi:MAG TPA: hypothetical protein VIK74_09185, partial [Parasegetibacter sp.]
MLFDAHLAHSNRGVERFLTKTLRIMKITAIFVFAAIMQVQASGYAQNITLTLKNAPLQKAFAEIGKQSGYQFFFNERLLKNARLVSLE